jgi:hypothetical protein
MPNGAGKTDQRKLEEGKINQVEPTRFNPQPLTEEVIYHESSGKWITLRKFEQMEKENSRQGAIQINEEIMRKVVDFKGVKNLIDMLIKIPGFKIKCSEKEKEIIGQEGSLIVMGRSGTGKTTCAVLRLFTVQMLFHIKQSLAKTNENIRLRDTRIGMEREIELHSIFTTASPCLAREIERFYHQFEIEVKKLTNKKKGLSTA